MKFDGSGNPVVPAASDGAVPIMLATELTLARSGAIDTDLLAQRQFCGTDFTQPPLSIPFTPGWRNLAAPTGGRERQARHQAERATWPPRSPSLPAVS